MLRSNGWWFAAVPGVMLGVGLVFAPAAWLGGAIEAYSPMRLVDAHGTVWSGSAQVAVSDGRHARLLPGRLAWEVEWASLLQGGLRVALQHEYAQAPVRIRLRTGAVTVDAGELRVPARLLAVLGAPFNTVRPGGTLHFQWDTMDIRREGFEGRMQLDWNDALSALSPVSPLGTYRLTVSGTGTLGEATLETLRGPLMLEGRGSMDGRGIRFSGTAAAQPEMRARLDGLLGVLGRRAGDGVLLNWEIRK